MLFHAGEALELEFDDGLGLAFAEFEFGDEGVAGFAGALGGADEFDDAVEMMMSVARGEIDERALGAWLSSRVRVRPTERRANQ